ncbi:MAG: hypothetical protein Pg6A_17120 [Termitinemataceae bacterium]|jgi:hypothetical protein|nr:MAG: hypothetical protein Pg6A_17120 [Termitinemataceae bacterium]
MTKKTATFLLIASAALFNIVTFFTVFIALMFIFFLFSFKMLADEGLAVFATPLLVVIFIASAGLSFFIYRMTLSFFLSKVDPEGSRFLPLVLSLKKTKDTQTGNNGEGN